MTRTGTARLPALGLLALLASAGTAAAQLPPEEPPVDFGGGLEVSVFGGVLAPLGDLTSDPNSFATVVTAAPSAGAEAVFWLGSGLGIGAQGIWAPADLQVQATDFEGAVPTELGDATWLAGTANLMWRLQLSGAAEMVQPFFAVGAGIRRLDVSPQAAPEVRDATDPVASFGGGVHVRVGSAWRVRVELRDYVSSFSAGTTDDSRVQNDLSVSVGAAYRIR